MENKTNLPEPQPINSAPKSYIPVFIRVVTVSVMLVATGVVFFFFGKTRNTNTAQTTTPTVNPTVTSSNNASWKTYSNEKYNFTIEYPSDLVMSEISNTNKNGASFSDAISIAVGKTLLNYQTLSLEEFAKIAGSETENRNSLASYKKVITVTGIVGYKTTWMVQTRSMKGNPPTAKESESLPITYFELPGNKMEIVRVELLKSEYLNTYEKMLATVNIMAPLTPIPTVDEAAVLKNVIKKYIALKHNSKEDLTITVSKIEGMYAQGGASGEGGGGMWLASKEVGAWVLVWDGNGTIECSTFSLYPDFPPSMVPECYDSAKQISVKR